MKVVLSGFVLVVLSISGCSKAPTVDNSYYDRANSASQDSLRSLERDTK